MEKIVLLNWKYNDKCFLLSSLWVCKVLLMEYWQNYAVLVGLGL